MTRRWRGSSPTRGLDCCLMHMLGEPRTMQHDPRYGDVVSDVKAFLEERMAFAVREGVPEARIQLDPGIGFGKTMRAQPELLARLDELADAGAAAGDRDVAQVVPRPAHRARRDRAGARDGRDVRDRAGARRVACSASTTWPRSSDALQGRCCYFRGMADEPEEYDDDLDDDDDDEEGLEVGVTIEIVGLSLYTHHGVTAEERKVGQRHPARRALRRG